MVLLFLRDPKSPCMSMMGGPAADETLPSLFGFSWTWYASVRGFFTAGEEENKRENTGLRKADLHVAVPIGIAMCEDSC